MVVNFNPMNPVNAEDETTVCYLKSLVLGEFQSCEMVNPLSEKSGECIKMILL